MKQSNKFALAAIAIAVAGFGRLRQERKEPKQKPKLLSLLLRRKSSSRSVTSARRPADRPPRQGQRKRRQTLAVEEANAKGHHG